jgi:hypothetical protein
MRGLVAPQFSACLPPAVASEAAALHAASLRASSQKVLASRVKQYETAVRELRLGDPFPVEDFKVWGFLVWLRDRGSVHPKAFKQYVSAVSTVTRMRGEPWVAGPEVNGIIAGCLRLVRAEAGVAKRGHLPATVALRVLEAGCTAQGLADVLAALVVQFCFVFFSRSETAMALLDSDVAISEDGRSLAVTAFQHKGRTPEESARLPPQELPLQGVPELAQLLTRFRTLRGPVVGPYLLSLDGSRPTAQRIQAAFARGVALPGVPAPPPNVVWTSHSGRHGGATAAYQARLPTQWITSWGAWAPGSPCLSLYVHVTAPYDENCLKYFGHFLQ